MPTFDIYEEKIRVFFDNSPTNILLEVFLDHSFTVIDELHLQTVKEAGEYLFSDQFKEEYFTDCSHVHRYRVKFVEPNWINICCYVLAQRFQSPSTNRLERSLTLNALLLKCKIECTHRTWDGVYDSTIAAGYATKFLVINSNLLHRRQLLSLKAYVDEFLGYMLEEVQEFRSNEFDGGTLILLPQLAKKHPSLGVNLKKYLAVVFNVIFFKRDIKKPAVLPPYFELLLVKIVHFRRCFDLEVSELIIELIDIAMERGGETYDLIAQKAKQKLSRPSMAWVRIRYKVRSVVYFSLLRNEAAERLYCPGGSGARASKRSFEAMASAM